MKALLVTTVAVLVTVGCGGKSATKTVTIEGAGPGTTSNEASPPAERRQLRREGSAVVTPVKEYVRTRLGPEATFFGRDEEVAAYLQETRQLWWNELRQPVRPVALSKMAFATMARIGRLSSDQR
jgi:hypothetical protein